MLMLSFNIQYMYIYIHNTINSMYSTIAFPIEVRVVVQVGN